MDSSGRRALVNVVVIDLGGMARFLGGQSGRAWAVSGDVLVDGMDEKSAWAGRAAGRARERPAEN